jgi:DNA-binding IclR family transcriptional regulator
MPELAQEELAEIIGSSRPMVSKLLTEMTERGILIREGRRHILLTTSKAGNAAPSQREASLHPAFEPNGRVRAERRTTRGNPAPAANI